MWITGPFYFVSCQIFGQGQSLRDGDGGCGVWVSMVGGRRSKRSEETQMNREMEFVEFTMAFGCMEKVGKNGKVEWKQKVKKKQN